MIAFLTLIILIVVLIITSKSITAFVVVGHNDVTTAVVMNVHVHNRIPMVQQQRSSLVSSSSSLRTHKQIVPVSSNVVLYSMKRPIIDQIATFIYQLETQRVNSSSVLDDQGRYGEPMEWSETSSLPNRISEFIAKNPIGYTIKQYIANIIAGNDYDQEYYINKVNECIKSDTIVMFSFTTCPFCRKAKDILDDLNVSYTTIELDTMPDNEGNIIRATLGQFTKRTSMPNIFINNTCIGGCNDGYPGLIPYIESGSFNQYITTSTTKR